MDCLWVLFFSELIEGHKFILSIGISHTYPQAPCPPHYVVSSALPRDNFVTGSSHLRFFLKYIRRSKDILNVSNFGKRVPFSINFNYSLCAPPQHFMILTSMACTMGKGGGGSDSTTI